jgi:hypothetical protein
MISIWRLTFLFILFFQSVHSQLLDNTQRAWLFRVISKTPVLSASASQCFEFNKMPFYEEVNGIRRFNWEKATRYMIDHPEQLKINFDCLAQQPNGLLGEMSVKLALYELTEHLNKPRYNGELTDTVSIFFYNEVAKSLPEGLSNKPQSRRAREVVDVVMNPSNPISRKIELLSTLKLLPSEQRRLMERLVKTCTQWVNSRSSYYFKILSRSTPGMDYNSLKMLAAGDGSGTNGLLGEYEINPVDSSITGYSKGVGLFTYDYAIKHKALVTQNNSEGELDLPVGKTNAIHCSLWGLDSDLNPLIVFIINNKSYRLYTIGSSGYLTPDTAATRGLSFKDWIKKVVEKRINKPLAKMGSASGLGPVLENELSIKAKMQDQLKNLGREIDSLKKQNPVNELAVNSRSAQINTLLSNLSAKERHIKDIGRQISAQAMKIDNTRKLVEEMEKLLGPNPQAWKREGSLFTFSDGVKFDMMTQDLIFPASQKPQKVKVGLVAASMTLSGKLRDEVQIFVNLTHPKPLKSEEKKCEMPSVSQSATPQWEYHYKPDSFDPHETVDSMLQWFKSAGNFKKCTIQLVIKKPHVVSADSAVHYQSLYREQQMPITRLGRDRYTRVEVLLDGNDCQITVYASADAVATRLSGLSPDIRQRLGVSQSSVANNRLLAVLRGYWLAARISGLLSCEKQIVKPLEISNAEWENICNIVHESQKK